MYPTEKDAKEIEDAWSNIKDAVLTMAGSDAADDISTMERVIEYIKTVAIKG
jgi:hypothetical protein